MNDFFKKALPYISVNAVCLILPSVLYGLNREVFTILSLLVFAEIAETFGAAFSLYSASAVIKGLTAVSAAVLINVFAFKSVKLGKPKAGVILSLLGGSVCSFIAVKAVNGNYPAKTAVYIIFNIFIWVLVWLAVPIIAVFL